MTTSLSIRCVGIRLSIKHLANGAFWRWRYSSSTRAGSSAALAVMTPGTRLKTFSTRVTQAAQVMPSNRVRIFVNGRLQFAGDAGWATRDYRFLGTVGRQDAVAIDLDPGRNDVTFAVSESFGGWAVTADLPRRDGLRIQGEPGGATNPSG